MTPPPASEIEARKLVCAEAKLRNVEQIAGYRSYIVSSTKTSGGNIVFSYKKSKFAFYLEK